MGDNLEFAGPDPNSNSFTSTKTNFNISNELRNVTNLCQIEDFGRESLGIFDISNLDLGRESLSVPRSDIERESLGMINLDNLDIKRESLGITNIKTYDFVISNVNLPEVPASSKNDIPSINFSCESISPVLSKMDDNSNNVNSVLNMAFLHLPKTSVSSSVSSINPSFNSNSLDSTIPSRIYSAGSNDLLNDAFGSSSDFVKKLQSAVSSFKSSIYSFANNNNILNKQHRRIHSLPSTLESQYSDINSDLDNLQLDKDLMLTHEDCKQVNEKRAVSFTEEIINEDDEFNDSVFIEGKHMASRITDGSFVGTEDDMLDSILAPEEFANVSDGDEDPHKYDTESIFKNIDKMFLPSDNNTVNSNPLDISRNSNRNSSRSSSSKSSKEALEIINTLSEILNNNNPSEKQKSEGQHLLTSLAEIFLSSASAQSHSVILDDSGHSSIESDPHAIPDGGKCYEVLDLRKKSSSDTNINKQEENEENSVPLDLSMKSKSTCGKVFVSPKILPPKYHKNPQVSLSLQVNKSLGSTCSLSSNDSRNSNESLKRFRPKKTEEKVASLRKGPMKAVLPIDNMARRKSSGLKITPTRTELNYKKKTSTPKNESNMKPMAQSTPDNPNRNSVYTTSPLARPSQSLTSSPKALKHKLSYSNSNIPINKSSEVKNKPPTPDAKTKPISQLKRCSSGDLNKVQNTARFVRSYSLGEKSKPTLKTKTSTLQSSSAKQRFSSPLINTEKKSVLKENKNIGSGIRYSVGKKTGKENKH